MGEPIAVADFNAWSGKSEDTDAAPFTTVAGVPLSFSGEVIGTLTVQDDRATRAFTQDDILTLELLAPQIAIFIRNARLYQELEERMEAQRLAEERLVRSAKLAAVGEMAAAVAHELNNPLTTVTGFAELILETLEEDTPEYEDMVLVLREAQRSRDVVRRLLDFSRQSEILRVDTDLNEVIGIVLALVHHQTQTSGIEVRVELWDEIPLIRADRNQMQQVLLNIIYNAIHSMPKGGELVIQSMVEWNDDEEWIGIKVTDTGLGISEENLEKIFEPFFTTKPSGEGTGLGLSVSYSIVSEHGGYIEVESTEGRGSIFTIWLPTEIQTTER
jgi:signal transduction histidine kinase